MRKQLLEQAHKPNAQAHSALSDCLRLFVRAIDGP